MNDIQIKALTSHFDPLIKKVGKDAVIKGAVSIADIKILRSVGLITATEAYKEINREIQFALEVSYSESNDCNIEVFLFFDNNVNFILYEWTRTVDGKKQHPIRKRFIIDEVRKENEELFKKLLPFITKKWFARPFITPDDVRLLDELGLLTRYERRVGKQYCQPSFCLFYTFTHKGKLYSGWLFFNEDYQLVGIKKKSPAKSNKLARLKFANVK